MLRVLLLEVLSLVFGFVFGFSALAEVLLALQLQHVVHPRRDGQHFFAYRLVEVLGCVRPVQRVFYTRNVSLPLLKHASPLTKPTFTLYFSYCSCSFLAISSAYLLSCYRMSLILLASLILFSSCRRRCISSYLPYYILHISMLTS